MVIPKISVNLLDSPLNMLSPLVGDTDRLQPMFFGLSEIYHEILILSEALFIQLFLQANVCPSKHI